VDVVRVEPVSAEFAHSGTAFFVTDRGGRRFKLRDCRFGWRAGALARWIEALPDVLPALVARQGRYLLLEVLEDHRPVTRRELIRGAIALGRIGARTHRVGAPRGPRERALHRAVSLGFDVRFRRDLVLLRRRGVVSAATARGALAKYRSHHRRYGLPVGLELDDLHKGNWMLRESDRDLRYVDEEGIGLRPLGTGLATLLKTATRTRTWERYRIGWAEVADASFLTMPYTEYLVLMDTVRRVAHKVRTEGRLEKLPDEVAQLRELAASREVALGWRFPAG
jgi:hypothetical protein